MATAIKVSQLNLRPGDNAVMSNGRTLLSSAATPSYCLYFITNSKPCQYKIAKNYFPPAALLTNRPHYNIIFQYYIFHYSYVLFGGYYE